jgi:hypothetical protein
VGCGCGIGAVPTARAAAAECVIGSREESDKSGRASSAGNQGVGVGRKVAVGISVKRRARIVRVGAVKESVGKGPTPPRWSNVAGRRSIFWSTRDWTMVELSHPGTSSSRKGDAGVGVYDYKVLAGLGDACVVGWTDEKCIPIVPADVKPCHSSITY